MADEMNKAKPQTIANEKWQKKAGYIAKTYKLKKDLCEEFARKCKENGESQAAAISRLMRDYIERN